MKFKGYEGLALSYRDAVVSEFGKLILLTAKKEAQKLRKNVVDQPDMEHAFLLAVSELPKILKGKNYIGPLGKMRNATTNLDISTSYTSGTE